LGSYLSLNHLSCSSLLCLPRVFACRQVALLFTSDKGFSVFLAGLNLETYP